MERSLLKIRALNCHLSFNEAYLNNDLVPIYTNVNLQDNAVRGESSVNDFRANFNKRETEKEEVCLCALNAAYTEVLYEL